MNSVRFFFTAVFTPVDHEASPNISSDSLDIAEVHACIKKILKESSNVQIKLSDDYLDLKAFSSLIKEPNAYQDFLSRIDANFAKDSNSQLISQHNQSHHPVIFPLTVIAKPEHLFNWFSNLIEDASFLQQGDFQDTVVDMDSQLLSHLSSLLKHTYSEKFRLLPLDMQGFQQFILDHVRSQLPAWKRKVFDYQLKKHDEKKQKATLA